LNHETSGHGPSVARDTADDDGRSAAEHGTPDAATASPRADASDAATAAPRADASFPPAEAPATPARPSAEKAVDSPATPTGNAGESHEAREPRSARTPHNGRRGGRAGRGPRASARRGDGEGNARQRPDADAPAADGTRSASATAAESHAIDVEPVPVYAASAAIGLESAQARKRGARFKPAAEDQPKLHKVLADAGLGSRRDMEELILAGRVSVNGQPAHIGQRIGPNDQVRVNGRTVPRRPAGPVQRVLLYHKPAGEICTRDDPDRRATVFDRLPRVKGARWVSVGRLDFNTEGLLIFTTSGDLANRLMHPRYGWEREYAVRVLGRIDDEAREKLLSGVQLEDGLARVSLLEDIGGDGANTWYRMVLSEGRNREVRRLAEAVGVTVSRLVRLRFGPVALPRGLARGRWLELDESEAHALTQEVRRAARDAESGAAGATPSSDGDEPALRADAERARGNAGHDPADEPSGYDHAGPMRDDDDGYEDPDDAIGNRLLPEDTAEEPRRPEFDDDEWQPRSANAHQEAITRAVRSGEPGAALPGGRRGGFGKSRGRGARAPAPFTGPMDHGRSAGGYGAPGVGRDGYGGSRGPGGAKSRRGGSGAPGAPGGRGGPAGPGGRGPRGPGPKSAATGPKPTGRGGRRGSRSRGRGPSGGGGGASG